MTFREFDVFMMGTIIMCCVMSVFNLLKNGRRGWQGMILSAAFLVFAVTVWLWRSGAYPILFDISCATLFGLIFLDAFMRASKPQARKRR